MIVEIDDPHDPRLSDFVDLADPAWRRRRERDEIFIAEGFVAVQRLVESGHAVRAVLVARSKRDRLVELLGRTALDDTDDTDDLPVYVAGEQVLAATVGFNLHRGVVAAAARRPLAEVTAALESATRVAVLEGLNDPENLGLVARTAKAFGFDPLVLDPTCIDPYYRRTVRVSMGEILRLQVARSRSWPGDLDVIRDCGFETWAMTPAAGATDLWELAIPDRLAVVLGAEGAGLSPSALVRADRRVRIPISPAVDSINVGHAAAVAFAAATRSR